MDRGNPASLFDVPLDVIHNCVLPHLDPASLTSFAFLNRYYFDILKLKILNIEDFSLACAKHGHLHLLKARTAELGVEDASLLFSPLCASEAIKNGHLDVLDYLLDTIHNLIGRLQAFYPGVNDDPEPWLDIDTTGQVEVAIGLSGRFDLYTDLIVRGFDLNYDWVIFSGLYAGYYEEIVATFGPLNNQNLSPFFSALGGNSSDLEKILAFRDNIMDYDERYSYFRAAIQSGDVATLKLVLDYYQSDLDPIPDDFGWALRHNRRSVIDYLWNNFSGYFNTPRVLDTAVEGASPETLEWIFNHIQVPVDYLERGPVTLSGSVPSLKYILSKASRINFDVNALLYAVRSNNLEMVKFVYERLEDRENSRASPFPLKYALRNKNRDIVKFLLLIGFNFDSTHFMYAVQTRSLPFMRFVKQLGCPITLEVFGFSANLYEDVRCSFNSNDLVDILNWLAINGAPSDYRARRFAAARGDVEMLKAMTLANYDTDSRVFTFDPRSRNATIGAEWLHRETYTLLKESDFEDLEDGMLILAAHKSIAAKFIRKKGF